jgi:hypothetical protein
MGGSRCGFHLWPVLEKPKLKFKVRQHCHLPKNRVPGSGLLSPRMACNLLEGMVSWVLNSELPALLPHSPSNVGSDMEEAGEMWFPLSTWTGKLLAQGLCSGSPPPPDPPRGVRSNHNCSVCIFSSLLSFLLLLSMTPLVSGLATLKCHQKQRVERLLGRKEERQASGGRQQLG